MSTTRITWRDSRPADLVPTADLADFLTRECGRGHGCGWRSGWEFGSDSEGFEDHTVRNFEGEVLADVEEF